MSSIGQRVWRVVRANLNEWLDRVDEFEEQGGFDTLFEEIEWPGDRARPPNGDEEPGARARSAESEKTLREYYANLEVPYGADLETVKESYRELMLQYHPDRYPDDPEMRRLAEELTRELTRAYREVRQHLESKRD